MSKGKAYLVGAGPGDIGLITVKGLEAIKQAEVILYDRLANPKLLDFAPGSCELIYCGKLPDRHTLRQDHINDLLVAKVLEGKLVVRLKGGDPGVFGRVGEEAEALASRGLPFEMIPGITSGIAAPLYAGIPVTHREFGETFAIVTAHDKSKDGRSRLNWEGLAKGIDTIAFYMGVKNLPHICENLIKHGKPAQTPVILIQWGTFGRQKTLEGTLETIAKKVEEENFTNPAITLVGEIVSIRGKINWFEQKPLFGKQILLPRTGTEPSKMAHALLEAGADVLEFPKWRRTRVPLDVKMKEKLSGFDQYVFTSTECVTEFFHLLLEERLDIRKIRGSFLALSQKSVEALKQRGILADICKEIPSNPNALVITTLKRDQQVLFGQSNILYTAQVTLDDAYLPIFKRSLSDASINAIVFPSAASVEMMMEVCGGYKIPITTLVNEHSIYCLGEQTAKAIQEHLRLPSIQANTATISSLIEVMQGEEN